MIDGEPDLDAIRKRDTDWRDNASRSGHNLACRDRRELLQYIAGLEEIIADIEAGLKLIRKAREPKVPSVAPPPLENP